jgi:DNA-binding MarR family transcriptional regulator
MADDLDPVIHQPTRLRVMMLLLGVREADFTFILNTLGLTNGNLSIHMRKMEETGYVEMTKSFQGRMPNTTYRLTDLGRRQLAAYWQALDAIRVQLPDTGKGGT